jgi:predicted CoA-substrate-specific enzyme activase
MSASGQRPGPTRIFCGVDVGASATKLVLLGDNGDTLARVVKPSGIDYAETARQCLESALQQAAMPAGTVARTVATGYGRRNVTFADAALTEIHCHGIGCYHFKPQALTIVDIGGQDNKVIRLNADGKRLDFKMNRKCAAGTGAFIEEIALRSSLGFFGGSL